MPERSPSSGNKHSADRNPAYRSCKPTRPDKRERKDSSRWDRTALRPRSPKAHIARRPGCSVPCIPRVALREWGSSDRRRNSAHGYDPASRTAPPHERFDRRHREGLASKFSEVILDRFARVYGEEGGWLAKLRSQSSACCCAANTWLRLMREVRTATRYLLA